MILKVHRHNPNIVAITDGRLQKWVAYINCHSNKLTILKSGSTHFCEADREDDDIIKLVFDIIKSEWK